MNHKEIIFFYRLALKQLVGALRAEIVARAFVVGNGKPQRFTKDIHKGSQRFFAQRITRIFVFTPPANKFTGYDLSRPTHGGLRVW